MTGPITKAMLPFKKDVYDSVQACEQDKLLGEDKCTNNMMDSNVNFTFFHSRLMYILLYGLHHVTCIILHSNVAEVSTPRDSSKALPYSSRLYVDDNVWTQQQ